MNASPIENFDGAGVMYTFASNPAIVQATFWLMCAVMVLVVLASAVHEISIGRKHRRS